MTAYRGPVTIQMSGLAVGYGSFSASVPLSVDLYGASLAPDGTLSATLYGSGPITGTVNASDGQTYAISDWLYLPATPYAATLGTLSLPFDDSVPGLSISWNETSSFDALRTMISTSASGSVSGVLDGIEIAGIISLNGSLAATTSAYSIAASGGPLAEGAAGYVDFPFTVTRLGDTSLNGSVYWQVAGSGANAAIATDFVGNVMPYGWAYFAPGQTQAMVTVPVAGDAVEETDEGFSITVANQPDEVIVTTPTAYGTILNDDVSLLSVHPLAADREEGADGAETAFTFTVVYQGSATAGVRVDWRVEGSGPTPAQPADFVGGAMPSGTAWFLPGESSQTVTVRVAGDSLAEEHAGFTMALSNPVGGSLGRGSATGLIIDDDGGAAQVADSTAADETFDMGDGGDLVRFSAGQSQVPHRRAGGPGARLGAGRQRQVEQRGMVKVRQ